MRDRRPPIEDQPKGTPYHLIDAEDRVINLEDCKATVLLTTDGKNLIDVHAAIDLENKPLLENSPHFHFVSPEHSSIKVSRWDLSFVRLYSKYKIKGLFLQI